MVIKCHHTSVASSVCGGRFEGRGLMKSPGGRGLRKSYGGGDWGRGKSPRSGRNMMSPSVPLAILVPIPLSEIVKECNLLLNKLLN